MTTPTADPRDRVRCAHCHNVFANLAELDAHPCAQGTVFFHAETINPETGLRRMRISGDTDMDQGWYYEHAGTFVGPFDTEDEAKAEATR